MRKVSHIFKNQSKQFVISSDHHRTSNKIKQRANDIQEVYHASPPVEQPRPPPLIQTLPSLVNYEICSTTNMAMTQESMTTQIFDRILRMEERVNARDNAYHPRGRVRNRRGRGRGHIKDD